MGSPLDMIRSMAIVMILVVAMWFFGQPPKSDEKSIRPIDPSATFTSFNRIVPSAPLPAGLPERWQSTVAAYTPAPDLLRVGYVTPSANYAEYAAGTGPAAAVISSLTADAPVVGTVEVAGQTWQRHLGDKDAISLTRTAGPVTMVVGTLRANAPLEEITTLAESLQLR